MGKTCEPKAFSFQCVTKFTTNKKKKKERKAMVFFSVTSYKEQGSADCHSGSAGQD